MKRKRMVAILLLLTMVFSCIPSAKPVRAEQELDYGKWGITEGRAYSFRNVSSGWYMNVKSGKSENGTNINLWPLDMSEPVSQRYVFHIVDAEKKTVMLSPQPSPNAYLDVRRNSQSFAAGQGICLWQADGDPIKHLMLEFQKDGTLYLTFAEYPEYCIGAKSAEAASTKQTQLVVCKKTGASEQRWILCDENGTPILPKQAEQWLDFGKICVPESGVYSFQNLSSGWYMNVKSGSSANGTHINLWPLDMSEPVSQKYTFHIIDAEKNVVRISPQPTTNSYLDVRRNNGTLAEGQGICLWQEDGDPIKKLVIEPQPDGSFYLSFAEYPAYCIGAKSAEAAGTKQTQLVVCKKTGAKEQRWILCDENGTVMVPVDNGAVTSLQYEQKDDDVHKVFLHYENQEKGYSVSTELYEERHSFSNGKCQYCHRVQVNTALSEEELRKRMNELNEKIAYFTTDSKPDDNSKCDRCKNTNVVEADWFKETFGKGIQVSNFPRHGSNNANVGWSCFGFACFAQWYLYKENNTDKVEAEMVGEGTFAKDFFWDSTENKVRVDSKGKPVVQAGDLIRISAYHSMIVYSCDSTSITVLNCNRKGQCEVAIEKISYEHWAGRYIYVYRVNDK